MAPLKLPGDTLTIDAKPYPFTFPVRQTALLVIDMQRDFILNGGFGDIQGATSQTSKHQWHPQKLYSRHAAMEVSPLSILEKDKYLICRTALRQSCYDKLLHLEILSIPK